MNKHRPSATTQVQRDLAPTAVVRVQNESGIPCFELDLHRVRTKLPHHATPHNHLGLLRRLIGRAAERALSIGALLARARDVVAVDVERACVAGRAARARIECLGRRPRVIGHAGERAVVGPLPTGAGDVMAIDVERARTAGGAGRARIE